MKYSTLLIIMLLTSTIQSAPALMIGFSENVTTITGSDSMVQSSALRLGMGVKIGFEQNFTNHFSLLVGAGLESRGEQNTLSKNLTETIRQETIENIKMMSLQIPILAQFNLPFSIFRFSAFGGPDIGVFLNGKKYREKNVYVPATNDQPARVDATKDTIDFSRDTKMLDCGINVGVAFEIKTGVIGAFFIRPSAYIGLVDILQANFEAESNANLLGKHQAFSFAIGYKFNIRQKKSDAQDYESAKKSSSDESTQTDLNLDGYKNYDSQGSDENSSGN